VRNGYDPGRAAVEASAIEIERGEPSVTYDTLMALAAPGRELFLVLGADAARQWLSARASPTVRPEPADEVRGERIVIRYRDKDFSLCDAIAFAVMDRLRARTAFTFDRHFSQYGFDTIP